MSRLVRDIAQRSLTNRLPYDKSHQNNRSLVVWLVQSEFGNHVISLREMKLSMEGVQFMGTSMNNGMVWNQLQDERQGVCQAMINNDRHLSMASESQQSHLDLLQLRLSVIDDALDRVASGSFGYC